MMTNRLSHLIRALALLIAGVLAMTAVPAQASVSCKKGANNVTSINWSVPQHSPSELEAYADLALIYGKSSGTNGLLYNCTTVNPTNTTTDNMGIALKLTKPLVDSTRRTNGSVLGCGPCGNTPVTIWQSGVPGIGFAFIWRVYTSCGGYTSFADLNGTGSILGGSGGYGAGCSGTTNMNLGAEVYFGFMKIGPIGSGQFITGPLLVADVYTGSNYTAKANGSFTIPYNLGTGGTIITLPATCSTNVNNSGTNNGTVTLKPISTSDFALTGQKYNTSQPFTIGVTCGGEAKRQLSVSMTFTDNLTPGNFTQNLTIAGGNGAAKNVALRITQVGKTTDVTFGPDTLNSSDANTKFFSVGTIGSAGGVLTPLNPLSFTASYVRLDSQTPVTPGSVNARATYTFIYQ
jgi:type 1 fimbria pilin